MDPSTMPQPARRRILWWFLLPLLTFGAATFAVVGFTGWRLRSRWTLAAAVGYFLLFVIFFVGVQFTETGTAGLADAIIILPFLINWLVGSAHAGWLELRLKSSRSTLAPSLPPDPALLAAQQRLARRQEARALLASNPTLAAELRIGRPDLGREYDDGGLVDINHVPAEVIARELGIPQHVADGIVAARTAVGGFHSADDLVVYCDEVTPQQVAVLRDRLLFTVG
ncbi:MAG TPA: helix-hairpin-helix domain-containing protein [Pseudonocardiaceae bacterium]|nr:helix-hairpin-helix domain-containing protein [Pseudonocardiaceae bacterium]